MNRKSVYLLILFSVFLLFIGGYELMVENDELFPESPSILTYFPVYPDMSYKFAGEGMEYAAFNRRVIHKNEDTFVQIHDETTGTTMARIFRLDSEQISLVYQEPEFYTDENLLEDIDELELTEIETILKAPLQEGATWETGGRRREIIAVDEVLETEAGKFRDVIKIKAVRIDDEDGFTTYEYYARNIGLILQESITEDDYKITSELESFGMQE